MNFLRKSTDWTRVPADKSFSSSPEAAEGQGYLRVPPKRQPVFEYDQSSHQIESMTSPIKQNPFGKFQIGEEEDHYTSLQEFTGRVERMSHWNLTSRAETDETKSGQFMLGAFSSKDFGSDIFHPEFNIQRKNSGQLTARDQTTGL